MAGTDSFIMANIASYSEDKYYRQVQNIAREGLQKYNNDPVLQFFKVYGMLMEDHIQEAIRELETLKDVPDVSLCSIMALIYAHKRSQVVDRDAVLELESELKGNRKTAGDKALYFAGMFLWLMGRNDKAKEYIDRMLKVSNRSHEGLVLKGWVDCSSDKELVVKKSIKYLEEGIKDSSDVFGVLGKVRYFFKQHNFSVALDIINQIIVGFPTFLPALIFKMKLFLAQQNWDQALETAQRIQMKDVINIDALQVLAVFSLARDGNMSTALDHTKNLISALETMEPHNPEVHLKKIIVVSRLCGKNQPILQQIHSFTERAFKMAPANAEFAAELAYQNILQGKVKEASALYSAAMKLDESSVAALTGIIWCQILEGQLDEAEQQLEFLREVQQSVGKSKELSYIEALLASKKEKDEKVVTALLKEVVELHFSAIRGVPLGMEYFEKLSPGFLVDVVKQYLVLCPKQPKSPGQPVSPLLKQALAVLNPVVTVAPAFMEALFFMAQAKYMSGDLEGAQGTLQRCLELDSTSADAHLLMAQIYLSQGNFSECSLSLETGVSHNFKVRDYPLYHLIKARALKMNGDLPEAIKTLKIIMSLPEMRKGESKRGKGSSISISERVSIYLELVEVLRLNGEQHEATKVMQDAIHEFHGTPEEIRITIANSDLALSKGDVETALGMLRNITASQPYFIEVKEKMAQIYLGTRKDKKLYIGCYRELCEHLPGPHTSLLLGDAYMKIQEPDKALEVYDQAHRRNPHDAALASRIGQALVKTHQYKRAISYYEAADKFSGQDFLSYDLAELLLKLKQYTKAERVLKLVLEHDPVNDLPSMVNDVKYLILLAKTYKISKREEVVETFNKAFDIQSRILKRVHVEQPEMVPSQKQQASVICVQLAEQYLEQKDFDKAIKYYKEALFFSDSDSKVMLKLARLHLMREDMESCTEQCAVLLNNDHSKEDAAMMMADVMFRKQEYEKAIKLFQEILQKVPDNFIVMSKLIDLLRRSGSLDQAPAFFDMALAKSTRIPMEPGFNYCKGLYYWHVGEPNEALKYFNKARKDNEWGENAIYNMVQICLNPDNEIIGGEAFEELDEANRDSPERRDSQKLGLRTAEKLLKEFHPRTTEGQDQLKMLQNYCLMATKEKYHVEAALNSFTEIATAEKENADAVLAVAQSCMILKQTPRARNQLKRLSKVNWSLSDAEVLEKSWLLLSDIYIKSAKYDIATELLNRCVQYNKSCCKAYEYLGFIMEKEQSYQDASANYELAWKYSNRSNPTIGFKLAFNYLKGKKYLDAIDVCHKVLKTYPNYPRIREEILEKAQSALRP
ncbi:tetratricopeptide repeat protein 21A isoform X2 [Ambystoma mexicanum]|uniref:tetratricopeptide repeat protein 21A isoform X2 n=1 Tax=Ambystoma mexicanum TaxID=8296 RepID=UPI0037E7E092